MCLSFLLLCYLTFYTSGCQFERRQLQPLHLLSTSSQECHLKDSGMLAQGDLAAAGVDTALWGPQATRAAAAAHLRTSRNLSLAQLCKLVDWSQVSGVFEKFYNRYLLFSCLDDTLSCMLYLYDPVL